MMKNKLGLYIHIPFCEKKCKYCDFNSFQASRDQRSAYLEALIKEISIQGPKYEDFLVDSIFIGGGSPSILEAEEIRNLGKALKENFHLDEDMEFTIELNPNSTSEEKLLAYREVGINRLSFGGQSFNDEELKALGRIHKAADIFTAVDLAKTQGFSNINLDLMLAIPGQSLDSLRDSLEKAGALGLSHLSVYSLILEENTALYDMYLKGEDLRLPDEDTERLMYYMTRDFLKDQGFFQYEISNYAKKGFESRHNLKYWSYDDYLGLGLSSHSKVGDRRFYNVGFISTYLDKLKKGALPVAETSILSKKDQINEYIFMGLRKISGFSYKKLNQTFGIDFLNDYEEEIKKNLRLAYIEIDGENLRLTSRGLDFSNLVELDFYRL